MLPWTPKSQLHGAGRGGRGASVDWLIRFCLTSALCELKLSHYFSLGPADGPTGRATHFFRLPPFAGRLSLTVDGQSEGNHGLPMECQRASTRDHDWTIIYPRLFQTNGGQIMFGNKRGRVSSSHLSRTITKLSPCTGRSTSVRTPGALHCHFTHRWQIWLSTENTRPRHFLFIF